MVEPYDGAVSQCAIMEHYGEGLIFIFSFRNFISILFIKSFLKCCLQSFQPPVSVQSGSATNELLLWADEGKALF